MSGWNVSCLLRSSSISFRMRSMFVGRSLTRSLNGLTASRVSCARRFSALAACVCMRERERERESTSKSRTLEVGERVRARGGLFVCMHACMRVCACVCVSWPRHSHHCHHQPAQGKLTPPQYTHKLIPVVNSSFVGTSHAFGTQACTHTCTLTHPATPHIHTLTHLYRQLLPRRPISWLRGRLGPHWGRGRLLTWERLWPRL